MADDLHRLLLRQIRKASADPATPPTPEAWAIFLENISTTYRANDHDRYLLERSLDLTSAEMQELYARIANERDRLRRELEIATVLQTSILPAAQSHAVLDIAAQMLPATEVGGDYYDILSNDEVCWIGIGDVAGHGLRTAMIMLMMQSVVGAMVRADFTVSPSAVLEAVNRALWDNIRRRLKADEHVTCTLLGCDATGKVRFAGAHEDLLVCRGTGPCERIETTGAWLAAVPEVAGMNSDRELALERGDVIVLFTDGVTEAMNATHEQYGLDRLATTIERHRSEPVDTIRDAILDDVRRWMTDQADDITVVVARYR
jgi:phosphoserine phosphatase RsbU/P